MNDAPMKPHDGAPETRPEELSEPHFDELAVLIAQPVEPIARGRDWLAWLEKPRTMIAILVVAGLVGTTAMALTLYLPRQRNVDSAATTQNRVEETQAQPEAPLGALAEELKPTPPRKRSKARAGATSGDTKPVARRVGVIVYGRGSGQP